MFFELQTKYLSLDLNGLNFYWFSKGSLEEKYVPLIRPLPRILQRGGGATTNNSSNWQKKSYFVVVSLVLLSWSNRHLNVKHGVIVEGETKIESWRWHVEVINRTHIFGNSSCPSNKNEFHGVSKVQLTFPYSFRTSAGGAGEDSWF